MAIVEPSRKKKWIKRSLWLALVLILGLVGAWGYRVAKSFAGKSGSIGEVWTGITNPRGLFPGKNRVVILIIGKDWNHNDKGIRYSNEARSDTIMLLAADLQNPQLRVLSVPRDTKIEDPRGHPHKINWSFQNAGVDGLRSALQNDLGIPVDYSVVLKDDAVKNIVDAVGGIDVVAEDDMFYEDFWGGLKINISKGKHHLNGQQAIGFVRFRKWGTHKFDAEGHMTPVPKRTSKEEGDIRRAERQQQVIKALMQEAIRPGNLLQADRIIETGFSQIDTDLTRPQVLALATLFKGKSAAGSVSAVLAGTDDKQDGIYYYLPDPVRAPLMVDWIIDGNESAGRKLMRAVVYNGSGVSGAARQMASLVDSLGFTAVNGGTSEKVARTEVLYRKSAFEKYATEIAESIGASEVKKDDRADPRADWLPEVKITLGRDLAPRLAQRDPHPAQ